MSRSRSSCEVLNKQNGIAVDLGRVRAFVRKLRAMLKLGRRRFNVCFVDDVQMTALNARYRSKARPTDVLSFRWNGIMEGRNLPRTSARYPSGGREFVGFLGDVVVSAETARRNARSAGHSMAREIRWLILHGALHLLGHNHETDGGEMTEMELALRQRLGT